MAARVLVATWREAGLSGCARKLRAAVWMGLPLLVCGRRTAQSVGAYFDLITDDARLYYGDSFHLGYFPRGGESLREALEAHTDLVAELARVKAAGRVLDVGCGIAAPALRIARRYGCRVTGINISREQVRQGRELIAAGGLSGRVVIERGDARALEFADGSFDAIVCLEAAGDICVTEVDKGRLVDELFRVLRPGGHVGFSDLALRACPSPAEDRALRAVLYHSGAELVSDWPRSSPATASGSSSAETSSARRCPPGSTLAPSTNGVTARSPAATAKGSPAASPLASSGSRGSSPRTAPSPCSAPTSPTPPAGWHRAAARARSESHPTRKSFTLAGGEVVRPRGLNEIAVPTRGTSPR
jgi:SAM-dependent methyltransferase